MEMKTNGKGRTRWQESLPSTRNIFSMAQCWMLGAILYCERAGLVYDDRLCSHKDKRSVRFEKIDANCEAIRSESEFMRTQKSCSSQGHTVTVTMFPLLISDADRHSFCLLDE